MLAAPSTNGSIPRGPTSTLLSKLSVRRESPCLERGDDMPRTQRTFSPVDGSLYVERELAGLTELTHAVERGRRAQREWRSVSLDQRCQLARAFVERMNARKDQIATELTWQIGRPIRYTPGEVRGLSERATYMTDVAPQTLADIDVGPK